MMGVSHLKNISMVIRRNLTYNELFQEILSVYKELLQINDPSKLIKKKNKTYEAVKFFSENNNVNKLISCSLSSSELFLMADEILNTYFIVAASNGEDWKLGDKKLIGGSHELIVGRLLNQERDNFLFALNFQSWINCKEEFKPIQDLEELSDLPLNIQVCDYKVETINAEKYDLVECKRKNPIRSNTHFTEDKVLKKIRDTLNAAKKQLHFTENYFLQKGASKANCKHTIIDISGYGETISEKKGPFEIYGFNLKNHIEPIVYRILGRPNNNVDKITLCWTNIIKNNGLIIAIIQNTKQINVTENKPLFNYSGHTIEMYPSKTNNELISQFRISSTARSFSWIKVSWYAAIDQLLTYKKG